MIVSNEIEQFCKELEEKLPKLDEVKYKYWKDKVHLLNRVSIEFMEYEDLMRKLALNHNEYKCNYLKSVIEMRDLKSQINYLEKELETVKKNING